MVRLRYQKSHKLGPVRITWSRSGWSMSVGGRRARVTRRDNGRIHTTIRLPVPGLRLEHESGGGRHRGRGGAPGSGPWGRWMAGLATLLGVVTVWLASSGVPTRFAVALAVGVAAAGVWGLAWLRIVLRSRQERLRPPARAWATPQQAEQLAWRWMRYLGHSDAELTGRGVDGGIDVVAAGAVAQVKATVRPTGRPVVQQAYGAAAGRACAVFARGGFTDLARRWADEQGVALFRFDQEGNVSPVNGLASRWIDGADRRARAAPDAQRR